MGWFRSIYPNKQKQKQNRLAQSIAKRMQLLRLNFFSSLYNLVYQYNCWSNYICGGKKKNIYIYNCWSILIWSFDMLLREKLKLVYKKKDKLSWDYKKRSEPNKSAQVEKAKYKIAGCMFPETQILNLNVMSSFSISPLFMLTFLPFLLFLLGCVELEAY